MDNFVTVLVAPTATLKLPISCCFLTQTCYESSSACSQDSATVERVQEVHTGSFSLPDVLLCYFL